jgi:hypothetical protein
MIETLSFEIDELIYSSLKAELSVETPFFTGKISPKLPRLINQWFPDEKNQRVSSSDRNRVRRHDRISCMMLIEYEVSSRIYVDFVRNVSRCGAYLETRKGVSIGESVILMIPLLKGRKIIRVKGVVVRKDKTGVGIVFEEILAG